MGNRFEENRPKLINEKGKAKLAEGQPVKLKLHDHTTKSEFIVSDFFYSGKYYSKLYTETGFTSLGVLKPIAQKSDEIYDKLKSEKEKPPYKIHIYSA